MGSREQEFKQFSRRIKRALKKIDGLADASPTPSWERDKGVLKDWLNPNLTYRSIGKKYGVSPTRARQITAETARYVDMVLGGTSEKFKEGKLPKRPLGDSIRFRASRKEGGRLKQIAEIAKRTPNAEALMREAGLNKRDLSRYRGRFAAMGINMPYIREPVDLDGKRTVLEEPKEYAGDLKEFLDGLTISQYLLFKKEGLLTPLMSALRNVGFAVNSPSLSRFAAALKEVGFPYGEIETVVPQGPQAGVKKYYFTTPASAEDLESTIAASRDASELWVDKISQIAGAKTELPYKRTALLNGRLYLNIRDLIKEIGINFRGDLNELFTNSTPGAPVFSYRGVFYSPVGGRGFMEAFIRKRLASF